MTQQERARGSFAGRPVLVCGATGRTGEQIVKRLREHAIPVRALCRSAEKAERIAGEGVAVALGDLRDPASVKAAMQGCAALISAAGAAPRMRAAAGGRPEFHFDLEETPEIVDYRGNASLVDVAVALGLQHVVLISSIGVTDPGHRLNALGNARLLEWKLRGEEHLRASGLAHTIVRPGRLLDDRGELQNLVLLRDDVGSGSVARADVGEVCVQALLREEARNKTFSLVAEQGPATTDFGALFAAI